MLKNKDYIIQSFQKIGQGHIFDSFIDLPQLTQINLLNQARSIDLSLVQKLTKYISVPQNNSIDAHNLTPPDYIPLFNFQSCEDWNYAHLIGEKALASARVAAFVVAGGMGTRLKAPLPKGLLGVTPVNHKPLFQVFAEKIKAAQQRYKVTIPWFIMTSQDNHLQTKAFFEENNHFGLAQVHFFSQGKVPAFDLDGKLLIGADHLIEMTPDGHGGSLNALVLSGAIETMKDLGIDIISFFQVDNPLIHCIDPLFIGFHLIRESQMSSKMVKKINPSEKVGLFCKESGVLKVIEYSDIPESLANQRNPEGELAFNASNIAAHLIDRNFVAELVASETLPFHISKKNINGVDGIKFEQFIFDALAFANNPVVLETSRESEFSPIKNAEGKDSLATCTLGQLRLWKNWLGKVGVTIPCDENGTPQFNFEISPLFADNESAFIERWNALESKPTIKDGTYLD